MVDVERASLEGLAIDVKVAGLEGDGLASGHKNQKKQASAHARRRAMSRDLVLVQVVVDVLLDVVVGRVGVEDGLVVDGLVGH